MKEEIKKAMDKHIKNITEQNTMFDNIITATETHFTITMTGDGTGNVFTGTKNAVTISISISENIDDIGNVSIVIYADDNSANITIFSNGDIQEQYNNATNTSIRKIAFDYISYLIENVDVIKEKTSMPEE